MYERKDFSCFNLHRRVYKHSTSDGLKLITEQSVHGLITTQLDIKNQLPNKINL